MPTRWIGDEVTPCTWWERVSADLDGEASPEERAMVKAHLRRCPTCSEGVAAARSFWDPRTTSSHPIDTLHLTERERRWFGGHWTRWLLMGAAILIVVASVPAYVGGDGLSPDSHAARHLASWQIGFGVGLFVAAAMSRMSHALLALAVTFATLTLVARIIDVIGGHHGPWVDPVHLMELLGVFLLWRMTPRHLLPIGQSRDRPMTELSPTSQSVPIADEGQE